jgi:WD40 repeat protein
MSWGQNGGHIEEGFVRHRGPVTCVAGIPEQRLAVTSAYDSAVALFELDTGRVELLGYHDHLTNRIVVNSAGTKAASSSSDYTIYLWDLQSRRLERVLRGHGDDVEDFVFIDDKTGASVSRDWRIIIWDLTTGAIRHILEGHEKDVLAIVSHGRRLYTSGDDMTLRVWDVDSGELLKTWGPFETETDSCAVDPARGRAVLGCDDGYLRVFDIESGDTVAEIKAHASGIKKVAISPVSGDILSAAYDQKIIIWDANTLSRKVELESKGSAWERSFNWSPNGERILAGTFDGTVLEWDAASGRCLREVGERVRGNVCFNDVSADGLGAVVAVSDDGRIRLGRLSRADAEWHETVEPSSGRVLMNAVTVDAEYGMVVCGAHNHKLFLFEWQDDTLRNEVGVRLGQGPINCVRICHHAGYEAQSFVACYSGAIVKVDRQGNIRGTIHAHEGAVKALRLHPHRPVGVSCSADGTLASWDLEGNVLERFLGHMAIVDDVDIDPSGHLLASVSRDFTLKVYHLSDGKMCHSVSLGKRSPKSMCFLDENTVVVGNYWGELIKFEIDGERVTRRQIARNGISAVCRQGGDLVACSYDGALYLVDANSLEVVNTLRSMTQRVPEFAHV